MLLCRRRRSEHGEVGRFEARAGQTRCARCEIKTLTRGFEACALECEQRRLLLADRGRVGGGTGDRRRALWLLSDELKAAAAWNGAPDVEPAKARRVGCGDAICAERGRDERVGVVRGQRWREREIRTR